MAHLTRTHADSVYVDGYITVGADFIDFDQKSMVAINGDDGGTWTPSAQILIGGAGVFVAGGGWSLSGGSANQIGGRITFNQGTSDDYFQFYIGHPERSVTVMQSFAEVEAEFFDQSRVQIPSDYSAAPAVVQSGIFTLVTGTRVASPLRVRSGGTIETVQFFFVVGTLHANLPQVLPRFRVCAIDTDGIVYPLRAIDATTDPDGFVQLPTPASASAYYNSGAIQSFTYTCNQNQVADVSRFTYWVEVIEESGTNAVPGNTFTAVVASIDAITLLDGRA